MANGGAGDTFGEFFDLIGEEATFRLVENFGGVRLYIPACARAGGTIARAIGETAAGLLASRYSGVSIRIPLARAWRVKVYRGRGMSYSEIARCVGITDTAVHNLLQGMGLTDGKNCALGRIAHCGAP
jgi:hypothetical protein